MFLYYKKRFQTCLQMLEQARREFPELRDQTMSYAGVLDPMAEGWVSVLVGKEENRDRVRYTQSDKEYLVDIVAGVSTDSGDLMGVVEEFVGEVGNSGVVMKVVSAVERYSASFEQQVSRFANKKVRGKPLWLHALEGREIADQDLPAQRVEIFERELVGRSEVSGEFLLEEVMSMSEVFGTTFRMERIVPSWDRWFVEHGVGKGTVLSLPVITVRLVVSKGFFVREFVRTIGREVGVPLVVFRLRRTKILEN